MREQNLFDWLTLFHAEALSPAILRKLMREPELLSALRTSTAKLAQLDDEAMQLCNSALAAPAPRGLAEAALRWNERPDNTIVSLLDSHYPVLLHQISDPPPFLFVRGNVKALSVPQIAVVGSRRCSMDGRENTAALVREIARQGLSVCSGLAVGIDTAAHKAALDQGGITVAVLGTGVDEIYPRSNALLASRIMETGALVSEFPLGYPALPANFPRRNRVISGLSLGVLVIEAALQSGSLVTARFAMEQNRDVFAVPGSIRNPLSRGCHKLIREGAALTESAQDLWHSLASMLGATLSSVQAQAFDTSTAERLETPVSGHDNVEKQRLVSAMGYDPITTDALIIRTGMNASNLQMLLLALELEGVVRLDSGRYSLCRRAPLQGH